jgi:sulfur carrier protein
MDIRLNGEACSLEGRTLADLLALQRIDAAKPGVAVAVNAKVVPRAAWTTMTLNPGDEIDIVRPLNGG